MQGHSGPFLLTMCIVTGVRTRRIPPRSWEVTWQIPGCDYSPCDGEWGQESGDPREIKVPDPQQRC